MTLERGLSSSYSGNDTYRKRVDSLFPPEQDERTLEVFDSLIAARPSTAYGIVKIREAILDRRRLNQ